MLVIVNEKGEQVKTAKRKVSRIGVDITVSSSPDSRKDSRLKVLDFATQVLSDSSLSQLLPSVCESSLLELLYNRGHERQDQEQTNTVRMCLNAGLIPQFSEEFSVSVGQVNVDLLRTTKTLLERAVRSFSRIFLYSILEHKSTTSNTRLEQVPSHPGFLLQKATRRRVLLARLVYDELSNVTTKEIEKFISNSVYTSSAKELMSFFEDSVKKEVDIPSKILNEAICVDKVGGDDSTREQRIQKTEKAQTLLRLLISLLVPRKQSNAVLGSILNQILTHTTEILENLVTDTVTKHSVCDVDVANVCSMIPFVSDVIVLLSVHSQDTAALRCALPAISKLLSTLSRARGLFPVNSYKRRTRRFVKWNEHLTTYRAKSRFR